MKLRLIRDFNQPDPNCTYGRLVVAGNIVLQTIERPWLDNQKGTSCVPEGEYRLELHDSDGHPHSFALVNPSLGVIHYPDARLPLARTACLIHAANWAAELRGCIAPGVSRAITNNQSAVVDSRKAIDVLNLLVPWTTGHTLTIERGKAP